MKRYVVALLACVALASAFVSADLFTKNWRVYNVKPAT